MHKDRDMEEEGEKGRQRTFFLGERCGDRRVNCEGGREKEREIYIYIYMDPSS